MRELLGSSPFSLSVVASCVRLQLKPLPSIGVTRLLRYYEPLRHPTRPGLSLTSCQLIRTAITAGTSRVASDPLCLHAVANSPAGPMETCSLVPSHRLRPSPNRRRVGPCITLFEACSTFTHVTACMPAESPMRPSTPKASAASLPPLLLRLLPGGANQFPGGCTPAVDRRLFTAHSGYATTRPSDRREAGDNFRVADNTAVVSGMESPLGREFNFACQALIFWVISNGFVS